MVGEEKTGGGEKLEMGIAETAQESEMLLEKMLKEPEAVLETLDPADRDKVVADLYELADRSEKVQSEADLMAVANKIWRLIESTPGLDTFLLEFSERPKSTASKRRKITAAYHERSRRESQYAQERAAQIRNRIIECRQNLERALQETVKRPGEDGH